MIKGGVSPSCGVPLFNKRKLGMKDGRLERIEAKISSDDAVEMVRFPFHDCAEGAACREFVAAANRHTGITRSAKILCWKKAEERGVAKRSRAPRAASRGIFRSDGLGSIFDDRQVIRHNRLAGASIAQQAPKGEWVSPRERSCREE